MNGMRTSIRTACFFAFAFGMLISFGERNADAQSLFERRSPLLVDQHRAITASQKGDMLTVLINEATDVESADARTLGKSGDSSFTGDLSYGLSEGLGSATGTGSLNQSSSSSRNFSGDSQFRSERQFSDRITVVVTDVLPNGNLVVAGKRHIDIQGDTRTLTLTGVVRTFDLLQGNTVNSRLVANLKITLKGKGPEQKFVKQGWFSRKMNKLWPF